MTADAVLFDLDGVLVDSTAAVEGHWRAFAARNRLDPVALLEDLHGRRMVDIIARALPEFSPGELAREAAWMEDTEARGARTGTRPQPGALALTRALAGRPWAVVTSGTAPVATARMNAVGLPAPPVLVTGEQVEHGKPHPAPYLLAAERLGVAAQDCLVVEDAPAGLAAGRAAGSITLAFTTSHAPAELHADHVAATPADVVVVPGEPLTLALDCRPH
ncbi:HAD-IA family hydrolase [Egicoccus sp. AB-alg2]|uniref:HAD-IA family hydrolase n=1 Tax=Egicoccus sp. AB-alg2 TaxID=3242693 RepID=UPI00359D7493